MDGEVAPFERSLHEGHDDGTADASDCAARPRGAPYPPGYPPGMAEEVLDSRSDPRSAFRQVLHAFSVSEEDVEAIASGVRDATAEVRHVYCRQLQESLAERRQCDDLHFRDV